MKFPRYFSESYRCLPLLLAAAVSPLHAQDQSRPDLEGIWTNASLTNLQRPAGVDALVVSPSVWYGGVLIAAPLAGFGAGWDARIVAPFSQFVVSH